MKKPDNLLGVADIPSAIASVIPLYWGEIIDAVTSGFAAGTTRLLRLDLVGALDAAFTAFSRVNFAAVTAVIESFSRKAAENAAYYRRFVVTGQDLVLFSLRVNSGVVKTMLGQNQTLADYVINALAQSIMNWSMGKGWLQRILKYMRIKTTSDLIRVFKNSALSMLWLRLATVMLSVMGVNFALTHIFVLAQTFDDYFKPLPQDSARVVIKNPKRRRVNKMAGPDS